MNFYGDGSLVREAWRHLRRHAGEKRGRKTMIDGEQAFRDFVELEARAVVATGGNLSVFLRHPMLRIVQWPNTKPRGDRLNRADRQRLSKRHQIGQIEYHFWRDMRCRYGPPSQSMVGDQTGEPHPKYFDMRRELEERIAELSADRTALFFLNPFRHEESALAESPYDGTGVTWT